MKEIVERDIPQIRKMCLDILSECNYASLERLGGLTNHTYKVVLKDGRAFVVRLPGEGTEELINRFNEKISTQLACDLGIDAQLVYFGDGGEKVSCYINGAQTMCASSFSNADILKKAAEAFRILHTSRVDTKVPFDVFDMALGYEKIIKDNSIALFDDYAEIKAQIMTIRSYVESRVNVPRVPCHNDPLCENWVLSSDGELYLIDWEYAGMNDGMWDLADLSIEANFSADQDEKLLRYYLERNPEPGEMIRFHANKLYLDFLWALWGKARAPFDGDAMEEYGQERYMRLKQNLTAFAHMFSFEDLHLNV